MLLFHVWNGQLLASTTDNPAEFGALLKEYSEMAKKVLKRKMNPNEESELVKNANSIVELLKKKYFDEIQQPTDLVFKYLDGSDFPDLNKHIDNDETDSRVVKFTMAYYVIYKYLKDDVVAKIVKKSPLEMVPVLRELDVFLQFISANPVNFGHGVFSTKNDGILTVYATNEAILRMMKPLVYKNLNIGGKVFKLSRLASIFFVKDTEEMRMAGNDNEILEKTIDAMKRNTADDSRVAIYIPGTKK
ncbi:MAG: hypothetical protein LBB34_03185 [Holosporales bacterium]|nr:hypothetical protein [Holosporales bacterium]